MKKYIVGIDFGTFQTKVAINDVSGSQNRIQFLKFSNGKLFLPSSVKMTSSEHFVYGNLDSKDIIEEYYYFKMASAEDDEFRLETYGDDLNKSTRFYAFNEYKNYTPEFLSCVYISYIILNIKDRFKVRKSNIFSWLGKTKPESVESIEFTFRLGVPTEWSSKKNIARKRKFESILMIAFSMSELYANASDYINAGISQLKSQVENCLFSYRGLKKSEWYSLLRKKGLSVYPETAAAVAFLVKSKQLLKGYYATLDIGAGTSDISFFKTMNNGSIAFIASESYMTAVNSIYEHYANKSLTSSYALKETEMNCQNEIKPLSERLEESLMVVNKDLSGLVRKLFANRVRPWNDSGLENMRSLFDDQPLIVYGGGIKFPIINTGKVIYWRGSDSLGNSDRTLEKKAIYDYALNIDITNKKTEYFKDFPLLVVALGLAIGGSDFGDEWFDDSAYSPYDTGGPTLIPHPINEDRYIYDVLLQKWWGW